MAGLDNSQRIADYVVQAINMACVPMKYIAMGWTINVVLAYVT